jgi:hypothetical protein
MQGELLSIAPGNRNSPDFSIQAGIDVKIDDAKSVHLGPSRKIIQSAVCEGTLAIAPGNSPDFSIQAGIDENSSKI